jgi:DNA-binding transcriptional MerR regulator
MRSCSDAERLADSQPAHVGGNTTTSAPWIAATALQAINAAKSIVLTIVIGDPPGWFDFELCRKGRLKMQLRTTDKWLRIGEFARLAGVTVKTVRYYANCGLIVPAFIDPSTSYRFYRGDQLHILGRVRRLRRLGLSIAELRTWLASPEGSVQRMNLLQGLKRTVQLQMLDTANALQTSRCVYPF